MRATQILYKPLETSKEEFIVENLPIDIYL